MMATLLRPQGMRTCFTIQGKVEHYVKGECRINLKEPIKEFFGLRRKSFLYSIELILDPTQLQAQIKKALHNNQVPLLLFLTPEGDLTTEKRKL